ncbi:hypothetical protein N7481_005120 [Penicillium waksmanii]|uniref:uncharacterized protein n=1 Tax=Penicillium waksmanii TaxID=69791 RepID=UPI00254999E0|nr:uncharacterized protein N7481_005120 [Penicillium waksmanii]KAJ5983021.1 hypothetical protein N7481_005120 [Penicillium waksmanii]
MQFSHALIALVAASLANAQLPDVPACSLNCFVTALTTDGCSALTDFACHCQKTSLVSSITPCVQKACPVSDQISVSNAVVAQCKSAGHPIVVPPIETSKTSETSATETSSGSETTATATGSGSSSASATETGSATNTGSATGTGATTGATTPGSTPSGSGAAGSTPAGTSTPLVTKTSGGSGGSGAATTSPAFNGASGVKGNMAGVAAIAAAAAYIL